MLEFLLFNFPNIKPAQFIYIGDWLPLKRAWLKCLYFHEPWADLFFPDGLDWTADYWAEWHLVNTRSLLHYQEDQGSWWNHPHGQPLSWRTRGRVWSEV